MGDNEGVVDHILLPAPHDLDLAAALLGAPPPIDRSAPLSVDDGGRAEGLWVILCTGFLLHANTLGVHVTTRTVDHEE